MTTKSQHYVVTIRLSRDVDVHALERWDGMAPPRGWSARPCAPGSRCYLVLARDVDVARRSTAHEFRAWRVAVDAIKVELYGGDGKYGEPT